MEKQEWFEYFEAVNGRKPTLKEFSKAKASGFFEKEKVTEKEENITSPQQETPLSPKQVRENWVKNFELNHGRKPSFEEFFEGVEALKQPAPQPTTNPVGQTVNTQPFNAGLNQPNSSFGPQVDQSIANNQSQSDVNSNPQTYPFSSGPISPSQDTPQWSGTSQSNPYFTRPSSPYSQTNYTNTGQTAPLNTYAMTDSFWSNITTKHKSLLALMLIANLFFVFFGLKPAEGTNANGYIYESGSVFLPTKYSTDYYGSSNFDTTREFYKQINKSVAHERYKNLLPMGISVFVMGVAAFVLHEDQDFQTRVYVTYLKKGEK
ncbi:hypothetical protein [uncultured Streptococcus sp.]|uniref:hypothetical protein n=1 Tax=uncultured Streptococcus sp. TaxID=83427 RepID=UPI000308B1C1|nr:hypothetical protein [uncultured Streptococcus sp.]